MNPPILPPVLPSDTTTTTVYGARRGAPLHQMLKQHELVAAVKAYDPTADEELLNRAYIFAMKCHGGQLRASGDPYYSHPVEVSSILVAMRLDWQTIVTALLHDTVEDTVATAEDIRRLFGPTVAQLVDGVTKLTRIEYQDEKSKQAENFRKLVLAMSEDIRVLLVKLADRLHNMRTLHFIPKAEKRARIARETMDIYAPLAARIGIQQIQDELEDIAFKELYGDAYNSISARMRFLREEGEDVAGRIVAELKALLAQHGFPTAVVYGREKAPYSIWRKMQKNNITFEQLMDIMAFRVVVDNIEHCYQVLGIIHSHYQVIPGRFKDYISMAKPNGYQSLHTGVMGPEQQRIEIQIRTQAMQETAELGVAAHWNYKASGSGEKADAEKFKWLRELVDIVESAQRPEEFLENTKLELYQDQVFCFSPKGDVVPLPRGATPVDFAYAVHSSVGDTCVGAKVNGRMVPLKTALRHGDQVEIVTNKSSQPSPAWERFVVTGKARARVRKFVRQQQRDQYVALGKSLLDKHFATEQVSYTEKELQPLLKNFQAQSAEDLYANLGAGFCTAREVFYALHPARKEADAKKAIETQLQRRVLKAEKEKLAASKAPVVKGDAVKGDADKATQKGMLGLAATPLSIKGLIPGMAVHFARCCHPVPGDLIVGITTTGKGVTIHTSDCPTLASFAHLPERWLDVAWDDATHGEQTVGRIAITAYNGTGALAKISGTIATQDGDITNLKITNRSQEFYELVMDIAVADLRHLLTIIAALRAEPICISVDRVKDRR